MCIRKLYSYHVSTIKVNMSGDQRSLDLDMQHVNMGYVINIAMAYLCDPWCEYQVYYNNMYV